jgi:ribonuclease HI
VVTWIPVRFRDDKVLARCSPDGELLVEGGLVAFCYREGGRTYRTRLDRLGREDGAPIIEASEGERAPEAPTPPRAGSSSAARPARDGAVEVWTDGACSGNPGPSGLGVLLRDGDQIQEISEYLGEGTNNIAELTAILRGLQFVEDRDRPVDVMTDSSYCIGLLTKGWKAKKNQDLVQELRAELQRFGDIRFVKVPGHAGVPDNERADELATTAVDRRC